jgi:DNA-binding NarL/FixJ family response regulator
MADHSLVAHSVRAALYYRGYDSVAVGWPSEHRLRGAGTFPLRSRPRRGAGPPPDIALLLSDPEKMEQVCSAQAVVGALEVPWLVLTSVPLGPAWGALYESGATLIVSTDIGLDELCQFIDDLHAGRTQLEFGRRRELISAWRAFAEQHGELTSRMSSLTDREEQVLEQLYEGLGVRLIAQRGEVTEATVRSQVKAILRKLDVNSQIAAVAAYQEVHRGSSAPTTLPLDHESA